MSYINKDATLAAIANKAKEELADANHYFLEGVQLAVDVVEGMMEPKEVENGSMSCPDARKSHDRTTDDCISRQAAIDAVLDRMNVEKYGRNAKPEEIQWALEELPSAQPEIKPIEYRDCADAMLRMWLDNVVTDREYNRIMDKLNAHWRIEHGRFDQQTGGD